MKFTLELSKNNTNTKLVKKEGTSRYGICAITHHSSSLCARKNLCSSCRLNSSLYSEYLAIASSSVIESSCVARNFLNVIITGIGSSSVDVFITGSYVSEALLNYPFRNDDLNFVILNINKV